MDYLTTRATLTLPDLIESLTDLGIEMPADVADDLARLEALRSVRPKQPDAPAGITAAYIAGNEKEATRLAVDQATFTTLSQAWKEAERQMSLKALGTFESHAETFCSALATKAEPLIAEVTSSAALPTLDTTALLRSGLKDQAAAAAGYELAASQLADLYNLRNRIVGSRHTFGSIGGGLGCGTWRDPRKVATAVYQALDLRSSGDTYRRGIHAGGELWFPTANQADEAAAIIIAEEKRKELKNDKRTGGVVIA